MTKKILKFGGTSVGSIERIQHAAKIVQKEFNDGNSIIVVVSAMAGRTNDLLKNLMKYQKILIRENWIYYYPLVKWKL